MLNCYAFWHVDLWAVPARHDFLYLVCTKGVLYVRCTSCTSALISNLLKFHYMDKCECYVCLCCYRNPVKFWFIKNYMSPQMKRFVPEMAAHYGFHYQFVTYKWPSFLHKQVSSPVMSVSMLSFLGCGGRQLPKHIRPASWEIDAGLVNVEQVLCCLTVNMVWCCTIRGTLGACSGDHI